MVVEWIWAAEVCERGRSDLGSWSGVVLMDIGFDTGCPWIRDHGTVSITHCEEESAGARPSRPKHSFSYIASQCMIREEHLSQGLGMPWGVGVDVR